jgi:multicomponent Na+:H+ antiporter subunit E
MKKNRIKKRSGLLAGRMLLYGLLMALIWWSLSGGDTKTWWFGGPVVVIATLVSMALKPERNVRWRWRGLASFVSFFLIESVRGGVDVARCALHPRLPIAPAFVHFEFRLPEGPGRVFLVNTINLLPGTLSAELRDAGVLIHVLDERMSFAIKLRILEDRVAALFGGELTNEKPGGRMVHE